MTWCANLTLLYTEFPWLERFEQAKNDGFDHVEIQFPYEVDASAMQQALNAQQQRCVLINVPAGDLMSGGRGLACVPGREDEFAEALALCAEYVSVLKPSVVNVLAGRVGDDDPRACRDTLIANLKKAVARLSPLGVTVSLEAINTFDMPGFLVSSWQDMVDICDAVPGVTPQFDLYHMARMSEPVETLLQTQGARIGHIQFADVPGRHEPGTGELPLASWFAAARAGGYEGVFAAEYRPEHGTKEGMGWLAADWPV